MYTLTTINEPTLLTVTCTYIEVLVLLRYTEVLVLVVVLYTNSNTESVIFVNKLMKDLNLTVS